MDRPLNSVMEFDHVVEVLADGTVIDGPRDMDVPELYESELSTGDDGPWSLLNGYSGQYGYSGPCMHSSEYIGGRMERDILARPGLYVALVSYPDDDSEPAEWAVAYRER